MADQTAAKQSPNYGGRLGYAIFHQCIRWLGVWPAYLLLGLVVPWYVFFRPAARRAIRPYLEHRFPGQSATRRLLTTIRCFYAFGQVLIDQAAMGILGPDRFKTEFPGEEELHRLARSGRGLVLVTTHAGYWRTAMANMNSLDVPVHLQFQLDEHMAGRHFFDLAGKSDQFRFVSPYGFLGGMVELTTALSAGECVAVMGDRAFGSKTQPAEFLGEDALFPITGYHLALATGAELVVLLTARTGRQAYRVEHHWITKDLDRENLSRKEAKAELLVRYVRCLEAYLESYPFMWFNFFDSWNKGGENTN